MKETKILVTQDGFNVSGGELLSYEDYNLLIGDFTISFEAKAKEVGVTSPEFKKLQRRLIRHHKIFQGIAFTIESDKPIRIVSTKNPVLPEDPEKTKEE
ncbi:MAG: hypothetical protein NWE89_06475 [Candidatus Bathyarchaeota archaeon]|nr:hypothetical protein [Candidatus Bathyarchaeota archaeon]